MKRKRLLLLLALLITAATGAWAQSATTTYKVDLNDGTQNPATWQGKAGDATDFGNLPLQGVAEGQAVTLKYNGRLRVKSVKAVVEAPAAPVVVDLSMVDCAGTARSDGQWTANCYMVHTAGDYKLPLVYGNAIKSGAANTAAYTGVSGSNTTATFPRHDGEAITAPWIKDNNITVTSAELLWQDADGLITEVGIDGDYLTLTVGKDAATQEGNAVVAAKDGDGNIVWSWHIWVTKQTFATLTTVNTGSHTYQVTPVNLGWVGDAVSQGYNTFYQWGRKDAFPGTGSVTYSTSSATIADNIKNPATFYIVSGKPSNTTYYNMWDAQQTGTDNITTATVKTVYDPSPAGFCVPTGNLYYYIKNGGGVTFDWNDTYKGRTLTSVSPNVFFPASGYRNGVGGGLSSVGNYGYSWSASAYGSNTSYARYLSFRSNSWNFSNYERSEGYPVRAVQEADAAPADPLATPLTIEAITDGTIKVQMSGTLSTGMKYSVNGGTKTTITNTTSIGGLKVGDKVQFYGNGTSTQAYGGDPEVSILGSGAGFQTKVYGNIMSLLNETDYATNYTALTSNNSYAFYGLFWGNYTLIDASELLLPATTLTYGCYQNMFYGCSNLTTAPKLPATTLASNCYNKMFNGCTKLTSAYVKAAYTEANDKCSGMFDGCTALGAVLHTTSDNKASWEAKMGSGKVWPTWSVAGDWQD